MNFENLKTEWLCPVCHWAGEDPVPAIDATPEGATIHCSVCPRCGHVTMVAPWLGEVFGPPKVKAPTFETNKDKP